MPIVVSNDIQELTGKGEEWLVDKATGEHVIAKFIDGYLIRDANCGGSLEDTVTL